MFDLEKAIYEWRQQMTDAGLKSTEVLDELECHLRDDVEQQIAAGTEAHEAWTEAMTRMGAAGALRKEFGKACEGGWSGMLRCGNIGLVLCVILNLLGLYVFHRKSSIFFSDAWWEAWFPSYAMWMTLTFAGWGARWKTRRAV